MSSNKWHIGPEIGTPTPEALPCEDCMDGLGHWGIQQPQSQAVAMNRTSVAAQLSRGTRRRANSISGASDSPAPEVGSRIHDMSRSQNCKSTLPCIART